MHNLWHTGYQNKDFKHSEQVSFFVYPLSSQCFLCICVCVCVRCVFRALPGLAACSSEAHTHSHWLRRHLQHWQTGERREEGHSQESLIYSLSCYFPPSYYYPRLSSPHLPFLHIPLWQVGLAALITQPQYLWVTVSHSVIKGVLAALELMIHITRSL